LKQKTQVVGGLHHRQQIGCGRNHYSAPALEKDDQSAVEQRLPHLYPHLHDIAAYFRRESGDHTLQPKRAGEQTVLAVAATA
jgi:hypothetical protein